MHWQTLADLRIDPFEQGRRHGVDGIEYYPPSAWNGVYSTAADMAAYRRGYVHGAREWYEHCGSVRPHQQVFLQPE